MKLNDPEKRMTVLEWKRILLEKLPHLARLTEAYFQMLTLAPSQGRIPEVHDLLPPKCQIFTHDPAVGASPELVTLRQVRSAIWGGDPPKLPRRPSDSVVRAALAEAACDNLCHHYFKLLMAESWCIQNPPWQMVPPQVVICKKPTHCLRNQVDMIARLFGAKVDVKPFLDLETKNLNVGIWINRDCLTWPLVHGILTKLPRPNLVGARISGSSFSKIEIWYFDVPFDMSCDLLTPSTRDRRIDVEEVMNDHFWLANDYFIPVLQRALVEIGLDHNMLGNIDVRRR